MTNPDHQRAADRRMHLGEDAVITRHTELATRADHPAAYWADLAYALLSATESLANTHRDVCTDPDCRTCTAIGALITEYDAHDRMQPTGCGCPDHTTIPDPRATWAVTS